MNRKKILGTGILSILILLLTASLASAFLAKMTEVYPQDYSWRTGLSLEKETIGKGNRVKEVYFWTSEYPFKDPDEHYVSSYASISTSNIGWIYSVMRTCPTSYAGDGKLESALALTPRLEAKKVTEYDPGDLYDESYGTGVLYYYDEYGNIVKQENFGKMHAVFSSSEDMTFVKSHGDIAIFDPNMPDWNNPTPMTVSTAATTLQGDIVVDDYYDQDNIVTETRYYHDKYPIYKEDPLNKNYAVFASSSVVPAYEMLNWVSIPYETITRDVLGRTLTKQFIGMRTYEGSFRPCADGAVVQKEPDLYLCDYHSFAGGGDYPIGVDIWEERLLGAKLGAEDSTKDPNTCLRYAQGSMTNYPPLADGYNERWASLRSSSNVVYDTCGNPVSVGFGQIYQDPVLDINEFENAVSTYSQQVKLGYDGTYHANPVKVTVKPVERYDYDVYSPPLERTATTQGYGYVTQSTDEHGLTSQFGYDEMGRLEKMAIYPDILSSPTKTFIYDDYIGPGGIRMLRIKETRKLQSGKFVETYYLYDGMGRHVQTQTYDNAMTPTDTSDDHIILTLTQYDVSGRIDKEIKPVQRSPAQMTFGEFYQPAGADVLYKTFTYDGLGRVIRITNFDGATYTTKSYEITSEYDYFHTDKITKETDEMGNTRTYGYDSRGNLAFVELPTLGGEESTTTSSTTTLALR